MKSFGLVCISLRVVQITKGERMTLHVLGSGLKQMLFIRVKVIGGSVEMQTIMTAQIVTARTCEKTVTAQHISALRLVGANIDLFVRALFETRSGS